jgi:hypothetical protein
MVNVTGRDPPDAVGTIDMAPLANVAPSVKGVVQVRSA